jgi:AcrR family transcriptional regulator
MVSLPIPVREDNTPHPSSMGSQERLTMDKREAFFRVGEKLFSQYGYRDVSIEDIAQAAGMGTGSFYNYFPSKEAFYGAIIDTIERQGMEKTDRILGRLQSPVNKLKAIARFTTLGIRRNPILRGIITRDRKYIYPGLEARLATKESLADYIENAIGGIIREGSDKRVFRSGLFHDPKAMVVSIYNAILLNLDDGNVEELIDDLLVLVERGLKRRIRLRRKDERRDRRRRSDAFALEP